MSALNNPLLGKDWLQNFIPQPELRALYMASSYIRDSIVKQVTYLTLLYIRHFENTVGSAEGIKIGIIGLGRVGSALLDYMLKIKILDRSSFIVSTRVPDKPSKALNAGVQIVWDNEKVMKECDVIILCVLPHQADLVCSELKNAMRARFSSAFCTAESMPGPLIISVLPGTPIKRLSLLLDNYEFIISTKIDSTSITSLVVSNQLDSLPSVSFPPPASISPYISTFSKLFYHKPLEDKLVQDFSLNPWYLLDEYILKETSMSS